MKPKSSPQPCSRPGDGEPAWTAREPQRCEARGALPALGTPCLSGTVGYLLRTYPKVSETFILQEMLGLERHGMSLHILALHPPQECTFHALTSQVCARVTYIPSLRLAQFHRLWWAHVKVCWRQPRRYVQTLRFVWQRQEGQRLREFAQAGYLAWLLASTSVTHLHAHYASDPAGVAELVHLLTGLSYSLTGHAKDIYLSPPAVLDRKMQRARFVVTCTEYNRHFLQALSTPGRPIHRVYHGLDAQRFVPDVEGHTRRDACLPMILSVGRFRAKKGFPTLLQACDILRQGGHQFQCQLVGYGPLQAALERLIEALGLCDVVALHGRMTQDALLTLYRRATLFVLPCQVAEDGDRDGIPNVLMEAMAMQLPVVSTPVSGIPELITHMHNGLLVPPQDAAALAAALALLLQRPQLRDRLGCAGRETICRQFSTEHTIAQLHALLVRACSHA